MQINIIKNSLLIIFEYVDEGGCFDFQIKLNEHLNFSDNSLFRIGILSRPRNSNEYFIKGISVDSQLNNFFEKNLNAKIICDISKSNVELGSLTSVENKKIYLAFSGGFDSVSALALLEEQAEPVSMSFGGDFLREENYFKRYNSHIINSDIRNSNKRFNESLDWRFLVAPITLYSKENEPLIIATGSILEASDYSFGQGNPNSNFIKYEEYDFGPGVVLLTPVSCLSEYSTTLIARNYLSSDDFNRSLASLADENTFKSYRKKVLTAIIDGKEIPNISKNIPKHKFGTGFTDDVLALYFCWKFDFEWVKINYLANNSSEIKEFDMSFFEKYNQNNLFCDALLKERIESKFIKFNIQPYSDLDFKNILTVRNYLMSFR